MNEPVTPKCAQCGAELPAGLQVCPRCAAGFLQASQTEVSGESGGAAAPFSPPSLSELAPLFPQLEILELIGQGGMGAVYKARQKELDRMVALKILPPSIGKEPSFAERFAREAKALAKLNHPGIITLYEFGRTDGLFYFLMELVDGVNLRQLLNAGRLSPREALAIVPEICDALQYAHDQGLIHRDIKPENILLDRRGRVKVADFGLAKLVGAGAEPVAGTQASASYQTEAGKVVGTPSYMAPEQREHPEEVDARTDVYAVGVVFYQMLTGELPTAKLLPPSSCRRGVQLDVRLDEVVLRALEKEPERRYQHVSELKEQVETITKSGPTEFVGLSEPNGAGIGAALRVPLFAEQDGRQVIYWPGVLVTGVLMGLGITSALLLGLGTAGVYSLSFGLKLSLPIALAAACLWLFLLIRAERSKNRPLRWPVSTILGALWIGLFFFEQVLHYAPPGWRVTAAIRASPWGRVIELLLLAPLTILGWAAPLGATALGFMSLRQIRRSRGMLDGVGLALFELLFFPLLLLNGWLAWLGWRVVSQIGQAAGISAKTPGWEVTILIPLGLAINVLLIRTVWRRAKSYINSPPPPISERSTGTWAQALKPAGWRLLLLLIVQFALLETLTQLSVHVKESVSEPWDLALVVAIFAGLVWVFWPRVHVKHAVLFLIGGVFLAGGLVVGLNAFYMGIVRPNVGLYQEPDWMSELPGYQYKNRLGRAKHMWRRKLMDPSFSPSTEVILSLQNGTTGRFLDLDRGQQENAENEKGRALVDWARTKQLDIAVQMGNGQLVARGYDLAVFPLNSYAQEPDPQNVADYWLFEKYPPKETLLLWPMDEYWRIERKATEVPRPFRTNDGAFLFRSREGAMGVVEIKGPTNNSPDVKIRYKLVESTGTSPTRMLPLQKVMPPRLPQELVGIGAVLGKDPQTGSLRINQVLPKSPAAEGGLVPGLIIQQIDGQPTTEGSLKEWIDRVRGAEGTKVRLQLINPAKNQTNTIELTRQKIQP